MRKVAKIPRILKINSVKGLAVSVVFNNGESRMIDLSDALKKEGKHSNAGVLLDPKEFKKVKLANHTLSWSNAGETIVFEGKARKVPYEIGADVLYKMSKPDKQAESLMIGQLVRAMREELKMTQESLAQKSGTTRNYISRIENDKSGIELSTLQKIVETGLGKRLKVTIQ